MENFKRILDKVELVILGLSIVGVFFFVMQLGFIKDIEMPVFYDGNEIATENEFATSGKVGYIIIKKNCDGFKKLKITINGKGNYQFDEKNELTLKVRDNDTIEIDSSMYNERIEIMVVGISKNIKEPKLNEKIIMENSIKTFPKVKIN